MGHIFYLFVYFICTLETTGGLLLNVGKTQVYDILKKKTEIMKWWENCAKGKIKRELKKTVGVACQCQFENSPPVGSYGTGIC
jgi:hypothetical protein